MSDWDGQKIELDEADIELVESKPRNSSPLKQRYSRDGGGLAQLDNDIAEAGSDAALARYQCKPDSAAAPAATPKPATAPARSCLCA